MANSSSRGASVASAASVCSRLPMTLFYSVSLWLCGEYLLVAAMPRGAQLWPNNSSRSDSVASAASVCSRFAFDFVFLSVSVALW